MKERCVNKQYTRQQIYSSLTEANIYRRLSSHMEKGMATHSRILAWRIPWPEEPGGLQSMGSQRIGRD